MILKPTIKESFIFQNVVKTTAALSFLLAFAVFPLVSKAQVFSVGEDDPRRNIPAFEVFMGYEPLKVTYEGSGQGIFAFEGPVIRLGLNTPAIKLSLASGGEITGLDNVSYFDFGGKIQGGISLYKSPLAALLLPLKIESRYITITNSRRFVDPEVMSNRFRFGSLTGGAGLKLLFRPRDDVRMEGSVIPAYGFSFASGGLFGGSLGSVTAGGRLYADRLFDDIGLSLGYRYKILSYDIDQDFYDYLIRAHSIQLGVTF